MKKCGIKRTVRGRRAVDGAGVRLVRVFGAADTQDFDPFLMLDAFDSEDPGDYVAGFPTHPHRGIETITYLVQGKIEHEDSLGNKGVINGGESQWMTAGSGIMHQEMPKPAERMLGLQAWLNLPAEDKMCEPNYMGITQDMIKTIAKDGVVVKVLSGRYESAEGISPLHVKATVLDVELQTGIKHAIDTDAGQNVFIFLLEGDAFIDGKRIEEKTAVLFQRGDYIEVEAADRPLRFVLFSAAPLNEPIAWGGPIVMNTRQELNKAFDELRQGTFIKHKVKL